MATLSDNIEAFCFIDAETRPLPGTRSPFDDVTKCGAYAYAPNVEAIIWAHAIGKQPVKAHTASVFGAYDLDWSHMDPNLMRFYERADQGEGWFVAWNSNFDRQVWNAQPSFPLLRVDMVIDCMAQATASNLPGGLEGAGRALQLGGKIKRGKELMKLFAVSDGPQPWEAVKEWDEYIDYGSRDVDLMRQIFEATRALPANEWVEFWASERINDRGMQVDTNFACRAAAIAERDRLRTNTMLPGLTGNTITSIMQHVAIARYLYDNVGLAEARDILVSRYDEDSEEEMVASKLSADRSRVEALIAFFKSLDELTNDQRNLVTLLELRQFGASSSPKKFQKILDMVSSDVRLRGQYVFSGAAQTGRFSSKGAQLHNMPRASLGANEETVIELINELAL